MKNLTILMTGGSLPSADSKCAVDNVPEAASPGGLLKQWNLETPAVGDSLPGEQALALRGWAVAARESDQARLHVVVRMKSRTLSFPLNEDRRDVVERVCNANPDGHPCLRSGFSLSLPAGEASLGFEIGFETDGLIQAAARIFWA